MQRTATPRTPVRFRPQRDWYPYYAAFTEKFVKNVLDQYLKKDTSILDPWCGSGTTIAVCAKNGLSSRGVDINPSLTVIARARLIPVSKQNKLIKKARDISIKSKNSIETCLQIDMLNSWFDKETIQHVRKLQGAIHAICEGNNRPENIKSLAAKVNRYSLELCFYYTALFSVVRNLLVRFRSTNPMWIKIPDNDKALVTATEKDIHDAFQNAVLNLARLLSAPSRAGGIRKCMTGDATKLSLPDNSFESVITSPPYATRIDYVRGTLPELFVLGADKQEVITLRRHATGSPVVRDAKNVATAIESQTANEILDRVALHSSKGSKAYYYPWLKNYFIGLQQGLHEIDRTVVSGGTICLVVQDSRYKELHIDLQNIVIEILRNCDCRLFDRNDHAAPHPRALTIPLATNIKSQPGMNVESLLVFKKNE